MNLPLINVDGTLLLVGEGNFSFTVALQRQLPLVKIVSTSLLSNQEVREKHPAADDNIKYLKERGVTVLHCVDATKLKQTLQTHEAEIFSRITFNFPHVGGKSNIKRNRELLKNFFISATEVLEERGDVCVSLCQGQGGTPADEPVRAWHDTWQVVSMAACSDFILSAIVPFDDTTYPEYCCTGFRSEDRLFHTENSLTYVFRRATPQLCPMGSKIRQPVHANIDGQDYEIPHHIAAALHAYPLSKEGHPLNLLKHHVLELLQAKINITICKSSPTSITLPMDLEYNQLRYRLDTNQIGKKRGKYKDCEGVFMRSSLLDSVHFLLTEAQDNWTGGGLFTSGQVYRKDRCNVESPSVKNEILILWDSTHSPVKQLQETVFLVLSEILGSSNVCAQVTCSKDVNSPNWLAEHLEKETIETLEISFHSLNAKYMVSCNQVGDMGPADPERNRPTSKLLKQSCVVGHLGNLISANHIYGCVLHLDHLTLVQYDIPHISLLSGENPYLSDQFVNLSNNKHTYQPISYYAPLWRHDISFWENPMIPFDEGQFFDIIQDIAGNVVKNVILRNVWNEPNSSRVSRCYREVYQSFQYAVSHSKAHEFQNMIRLTVEKEMGVILR